MFAVAFIAALAQTATCITWNLRVSSSSSLSLISVAMYRNTKKLIIIRDSDIKGGELHLLSGDGETVAAEPVRKTIVRVLEANEVSPASGVTSMMWLFP